VNVTCGTEAFTKFDFLSRLEEIDAIATDLAKNHPGQKLVLIGHSAGATLAALYADKHPDKIAAVIDLGGSLDSLDKVIKEAEREKGYDAKTLRENEETLDAAISESSGGGSPDKAMWGRTEKFWGEMFSTDIKNIWLKLAMPVLVVHGDGDKDVPYSLLPKARREFKRANKTNYTFALEEGMGHDLLNSDVFTTIDGWLKRRVTGDGTGSEKDEDNKPEKGD
jgi:pimeloyl-ACP methyl ester carboxylesterase